MDEAAVRDKLKEILVSEMNLEGMSPADIEDDGALFGDGLGLDSLDALQLAMAIEEHFGVRVPEAEEARPLFASVNTLAKFIVSSCASG